MIVRVINLMHPMLTAKYLNLVKSLQSSFFVSHMRIERILEEMSRESPFPRPVVATNKALAFILQLLHRRSDSSGGMPQDFQNLVISDWYQRVGQSRANETGRSDIQTRGEWC